MISSCLAQLHGGMRNRRVHKALSLERACILVECSQEWKKIKTSTGLRDSSATSTNVVTVLQIQGLQKISCGYFTPATVALHQIIEKTLPDCAYSLLLKKVGACRLIRMGTAEFNITRTILLTLTRT